MTTALIVSHVDGNGFHSHSVWAGDRLDETNPKRLVGHVRLLKVFHGRGKAVAYVKSGQAREEYDAVLERSGG